MIDFENKCDNTIIIYKLVELSTRHIEALVNGYHRVASTNRVAK